MPDTTEHWKTVLSNDSLKKKYTDYVQSWEKKIGSFLDFRSTAEHSGSDGKLSGLPFAVKDNIAVKNFQLSCGSKILEGLRSPYNATGVQKLIDAGAVCVGKTNLDEFGMGSSTDNSALGTTNNPYDNERVAGGSSGGSAAAVAAGLVPFALGTDTGGSVRQPANFCGVYGLKPTYGAVSRYGLTAYASSLEVLGVMSRSIQLMEDVFEVIKGEDPMDHTTLPYNAIDGSVKRIAVLKLNDSAVSPSVMEGYKNAAEALKGLGYELNEIELKTLDYVVPSYYTIATAEASANLARFNGIRYGYAPMYAENPQELQKKARHEGFGDEVKLRVLLGTYVLRSGFQDQFYVKAQKIRTAIRNEINSHFEHHDALLMPVFPTQAFHHGSSDLDSFQQKVADLFTCTANLAGLPALSMPVGLSNGLPLGVQLMAPAFGEQRLFRVAEQFEQKFPVPEPEGFAEVWS